MSHTDIIMEQSQVYPLIKYLVTMRAATPEDRKTMLRNITRHQLLAIEHLSTGLVNGWINPLRKDAELLKRNKKLRALSAPRISFQRKKQLVYRHHSVIPTLLKSVYLIQTIVSPAKIKHLFDCAFVTGKNGACYFICSALS